VVDQDCGLASRGPGNCWSGCAEKQNSREKRSTSPAIVTGDFFRQVGVTRRCPHREAGFGVDARDTPPIAREDTPFPREYGAQWHGPCHELGELGDMSTLDRSVVGSAPEQAGMMMFRSRNRGVHPDAEIEDRRHPGRGPSPSRVRLVDDRKYAQAEFDFPARCGQTEPNRSPTYEPKW